MTVILDEDPSDERLVVGASGGDCCRCGATGTVRRVMGGRNGTDNPFIGLGIRKSLIEPSCTILLDVARCIDSGPVGRASSDGG